jgi:hypothetical protein
MHYLPLLVPRSILVIHASSVDQLIDSLAVIEHYNSAPTDFEGENRAILITPLFEPTLISMNIYSVKLR